MRIFMVKWMVEVLNVVAVDDADGDDIAAVSHFR